MRISESYTLQAVLIALLATCTCAQGDTVGRDTYGPAGRKTPDGTYRVGESVDNELAQLSGPELSLQDSVVLVESDSMHVGSPISLLVGPDGSLYVTDGFANTITRFARTGEPIRVYGEQGRGPGEIEYAGAVAFVGDTLLGVVDARVREFELFDLRSGEHRGMVRLAGTPTTVVSGSDGVWFAGANLGSNMSLAVRTGDALLALASSGDGVPVSADRVSLPWPYTANPMIRGVLGHVSVHVGGDDVLVGFAASPFLLRSDAMGRTADTVPLVALARRGVPSETELVDAMDPRKTLMSELAKLVSVLGHVSRDHDGNIFTVHQDIDIEGRRYSARYYVSSIGVDGRQCPDTDLPTSDVGRAVMAFRDNELYVLEQRIFEGTANRLRTTVKRFLVDPC